GFTTIDLLVILVILVFVGGSTFLFADVAHETDNRVKCASNLRMIEQAMLLYANENRGAYPRTNYDPASADKPAAFTKPEKADATDDEKQANMDPAYCKAGPKANDVTAAYFRLIATQEITPQVFVCPTAWEAANENKEANETKEANQADFPSDEKNV